MAIDNVPTLDDIGWVQAGSRDKLDRLLADFFTTDAAQSQLFLNSLMSFQSIRADNVNDVENMARELQSYLSHYLHIYFDKIDVQVDIVDTLGNKREKEELSNVVGLFLRINYTQNLENNRFNKPVYYKDGVFNYTLGKFNNG